MSSKATTEVVRYELAAADQTEPVTDEQVSAGLSRALPDPLLIRNAQWFCRLRWLVIAFLTGFGLLGMASSLIEAAGLTPPGLWPFAAAAILAAGNLLFIADLRSQSRRTGPLHATLSLWGQIVLDLLVLTAVVHYVGSMTTYAAFAYLFHIVLACIFFTRLQSLLVTMVAVTLLVLCVTAEQTGILATPSLFTDGSLHDPHYLDLGVTVFNLASAIVVWLGVWYLAARLSEFVRQRDARLGTMNTRLVLSMTERASHMLTTTHQLKSPFAAIQANAELLLEGYCGPQSDRAHEVTRRIMSRCRSLAEEIQQMLQLANLDSSSQSPSPRVPVALDAVLRWGIDQIEVLAQSRRIAIDKDIRPVRGVAVEDHVKMVVVNLLSNAVNYSHEGGRIRVFCGLSDQGQPLIRIDDEGIGIPAEQLPRIFGDHYRTTEAARHNKHSSGLGLAIVRRVAELDSISVAVSSTPGEGTTFELQFISDTDAACAARKETDNGLRTDD